MMSGDSMNMTKTKAAWWISISAAVWVAFCSAVLSASEVAIEWHPLFSGIEQTAIMTGEQTDSPLALYALRVNLDAPGIAFFSTPPNGDTPLETDSQPTEIFLKEHKLAAAINANFFSPCCAGQMEPKDAIGLAVSNGQLVSPNDWTKGDAGSAILGITSDNHAGLYRAGDAMPVETFQNAVAGGPLLLAGGNALFEEGGARHPRTAVGLSQDKRILYWMVIDGRQPGYSMGATYAQVAYWLTRLGASDGMCLDGGGSSAMAVADENGEPRLLNRPSGGKPRFVSNSIGVYADPLETEKKMPAYIAHRGASWLAPENTLASVKLAWELGADAAEIDVYLSADERLVVIHDKDTKRISGVDLKVEQTVSPELRKLDAGRYKSEKYSGEKIPFLEEIIATIPEGKTLYVEVKSDSRILPHLVKTIKSGGKQKQIILISFNFEVVSDFKRLMPNVPTYWLVGARKDKETQKVLPYEETLIGAAKKAGLEGLAVQYNPLTADFVKAVRAAGLDIYPWTINDPNEAIRMFEMGITHITTDRPEWLKEQVQALQQKTSGVNEKK
jgi:glycerophosphoryl diester phosphodiesterase